MVERGRPPINNSDILFLLVTKRKKYTMETKDFSELKANPKNPRKIDKHDYQALVASIKEFGDLSGIVFNQTTGQLVGGHQRTEAFRRMGGQARVIVSYRFPEPNRQGTIALGYVDYDNEQFSYREVQWDETREKSANIAANRIQGQFDLDLLSEITYEISQSENATQLMALTGQTEEEVNRLLKMNGSISDPEPDPESSESNKLEFALTADQREIVEEALGHVKATRELQAIQNSSMNGAALFTLCQEYLQKLHNPQEQETDAGN